ncbi:unnamed protein product [Phaedon cochleariae]|uniref:Glycerate kinase n=1 Tax=Phaedon cochleariae TaxID=80249 RepID=A0A9P0DTE8_PHACE|nr:unnamed protein product [Phaedon cochleariae]
MFAPRTLKFTHSSFKQVNLSKSLAAFNNHCVQSKMSLKDIREIFLKSVEAVQPQKLIEKEVIVHQNTLTVRGQTYPLEKPCYLVGFGKAVLGMSVELERALGDRLQRGIVAVPQGIFENYEKPAGSRVEYVEGARNNLPDEDAMRAANMIKDLAVSLTEEDLLIVLISGGGSALLPLPLPPITLEEKHDLIKTLAKKGATINEVNAVRKRLSLLKGGGLAELAHPCRIVSLVLSDIIDDPLDLIASGPTMPDPDSAGRAFEVLKKYRLDGELPHSMEIALRKEKRVVGGRRAIVDGEYEHVRTYVIGNNRIAALAAKREAINRGFQSSVASTQIEGDVCEIGRIYAALARELASVISDPSDRDNLEVFLETFAEHFRVDRTFIREVLDLDYSRGICLIFAGEPTVVVTGTGKGGRNQQLALTVAVELSKLSIGSADVTFLSCGTDGIDGPTDAAGAIATSGTPEYSGNVRPEAYLENNDAYSFYEVYNRGENLVRIGHTGTNVMDIHILMVVPK